MAEVLEAVTTDHMGGREGEGVTVNSCIGKTDKIGMRISRKFCAVSSREQRKRHEVEAPVHTQHLGGEEELKGVIQGS